MVARLLSDQEATDVEMHCCSEKVLLANPDCKLMPFDFVPSMLTLPLTLIHRIQNLLM